MAALCRVRRQPPGLPRREALHDHVLRGQVSLSGATRKVLLRKVIAIKVLLLENSKTLHFIRLNLAKPNLTTLSRAMFSVP